MLYHNYYRIDNKIKTVSYQSRNGVLEFCSLCYSPECNHDESKVGGDEAILELQEWQDVCHRTLGEDVLFLDDTPIPLWPSGEKKIDPNVPYLIFPKLNLPLRGIVSRKETYVIDEWGNIKDDLNIYLENRKENLSYGVYWGYLIGGTFEMIRAFRDGKWVNFQRLPKLTHMKFENKELLGAFLDDLEDLVVGFWAVPKVEENYRFKEKCTELS